MPPGRILCVTSNYPRWEGDSTTSFVHHLMQDLQALGWGVDVLAPHAPGAARREKLSGVNVERFRYVYPEALETLCYQGGALINLRQQRSNWFKLPGFIGAEWYSVLRRLRRRHYALVHTHWLLPQGFTGVMAARLLGIPHVTTVHGGDIFALQGWAFRPFKRFTLRHVDAVTVNSSATERAVRHVLPAVAELHLIPMGVGWTPPQSTSAKAAELRRRYRRGQGPLLVFVGRIVWEKGVEDLIRTVSMLVPRLADITAVIVGDGQDRLVMQRLTHELGLSERIQFPGWVSPDQVAAYLGAGDIFVSPSRQAVDGWVEAQGLAIIEAMLARLPVIATRIGGIPDTVRHEETGLLIAEGNYDEMARAVCRLVQEPALVHRLQHAAYASVVARFSRQESAEAFSQLFEHTIQARLSGK